MPPLLLAALLAGLPFILSSEWSSTDSPELVGDSPLYPLFSHEHNLPDPDHVDQLLDSEHALDSSLDPDLIFDAESDPIAVVDPDPDVAGSTSEAIETEDATNVDNNEESRLKRSATEHWDKSRKSEGGGGSGRVKTGDTILNIGGAVRDAIGDAGAAPGPRASTRLDTFVIRPAAGPRPRAHPAPARPNTQAAKLENEFLVEAHSTARIPCSLGEHSDVVWYKDGEVQTAGSAWTDAVRVERGALVVGRATRGDAGSWRCTRTDPKGNTVSGKPTRLLIYEVVRGVYLAVDGRRLDAGNTWVPVRDKTDLEVHCVAEGGVPPPELTWRLLALEPTLDHRPYLRIHPTNYSVEGVSVSQVVVTAARELHNATLVCEARQRTPVTPAPPAAANQTPTEPPAQQPTQPATGPLHVMTAKLEIHVTYPPSFVISRWPGFGVALWAGGAAALRCDVDANPPARAWWLRDDARPASSPPPLEEGAPGPGSATLRWAALRGSHAGWYRCRASWLDAQYSSIGYYLNVLPAPEEETESATEAEPEAEEPVHQKVEVPVGGNVQLHCPKGSVGCWWRRVVGNSSESWAPAGSHHAHGVLGIKEALYEEGGEYRCVGARAPDLRRLQDLKRVTLSVTGGATAVALSAAWARALGAWRLECGACGRGVRVLWVRGGALVRSVAPASLAPGLAQHCWRAVLHVPEHDEVWCVAAAPAGGAVAVFPQRAPPAPSPAPARHVVRAPHAAARSSSTTPPLLMALTTTMLITST